MEDPGKCLGVCMNRTQKEMLCKRCGWPIGGLCRSMVSHTLALCLSCLQLAWLCQVDATQRFVVCISHSFSSWPTRQHSVEEGETGRGRVGKQWIIILLSSHRYPLTYFSFLTLKLSFPKKTESIIDQFPEVPQPTYTHRVIQKKKKKKSTPRKLPKNKNIWYFQKGQLFVSSAVNLLWSQTQYLLFLFGLES